MIVGPSRRPWLAPVGATALIVLICVAAFAPVFAPGAWFTWDVPDQYWADFSYLCGSLHQHHWPLWNPYDRGGYPFHADPQSGLYYPLNWAMCAVAGPSPSIAWVDARVVMHFALAGCAMTAWLRALGLAWGPSLLGGVAFMLAPYQRKSWEVNLSYTIAWLPALLWAIERIAQRPSLRRAAVLALFVACAAASGSPPSLYFAALVTVAYALARCGPVRASWPALAVAGGLALAMSAVVLLPASALARASVQHGRDWASIAEGSYPPRALVGLVWPHWAQIYLGAPVALLAVVGALRGPLPRALRVLFAGLALFALVMMLGPNTPAFGVAFRVLPGASAFRMPTRYGSILGLATAVLAAGGAASLPRARVTAWLCAALVLVAIVPALPTRRNVRFDPLPGGPARLALLRAHMPGDTASAWRVFDEFGLGLRAGTRDRIRDFRGYQDPLELARYEHVVDGLDASPALLEQYNVRYVLRGPHFLHGSGHHFLPEGREAAIARPLGDGVWETLAPLPSAYWVAHAEVLSDPARVLERLRREAPSPVCLLESADGPDELASRATSTLPSVAATHVQLDRDALALAIDAPADGWLVVQEAWLPGWQAEVDGVPVRVRRGNYLVRALPLRAGSHRVVLRYRPAGYAALLALAIAGLLASVGLLAGVAERRRAVV